LDLKLWLVIFANAIFNKLILKTRSFSGNLPLVYQKLDQKKEPEFAPVIKES